MSPRTIAVIDSGRTAGNPHHADEQADHCGQGSDPTAQPDDLGAEVGLCLLQHLPADHGSELPTEPAGRRRSGNAPGSRDAQIPGPADQITESVVEHLLTGWLLCHGGHLHRGQPGRNPPVRAQGRASEPNRQPFRLTSTRTIKCPFGLAICWTDSHPHLEERRREPVSGWRRGSARSGPAET